MKRPSRRVVVGIIVAVVAIVGIVALQVGLSVNKAVADIKDMTVPTVNLPPLPTDTPEPTATPANTAVAAIPTNTPAVPTAVPLAEPINILLMGTDARIGEDIARTDTMIVVRIDPNTGRISTLSLPRDLNVTIPRVNQQRRINTAYYFGEKQICKGCGPALAEETISKLLGIPIDHFALINFEGFRTLIDKLGGITIDVPKAIDDTKYPMDEYAGDIRVMKVHFDAGVQKMDGKTALIYSRTRHADSDFGRQARQQQVLIAIFEQIRKQNLYSQVTSIDDYTSALRDYVRFDMSQEDIWSLASLAPSVKVSDVEHYTVSPSMLREQANPYYLFINDKKAFKNLVADFVEGNTTTASAGTSEASK